MAEATRLIADHPQYSGAYRWRAVTRTIAGDFAGARADHDAADAIYSGNQWDQCMSALLAAQAGDLAEARRVKDKLLQPSSHGLMSALMVGHVEAALGDYDSAFEWYERAYQAREHLLAVLHTDRSFSLAPPGKTRPIANDPRWASLVRRIGLAP